MRIIKPKILQKGDVIGIVAPASPLRNEHNLNQAITYLERLGYYVKLGNYIFQKHGYLAGRDYERASDLNNFFADKQVKAIFALRGGYGSHRILTYLNYSLIKNNPKIFVGYSDITAIQLALYKKCGLVTFAGPMIEPDFAKHPGSNSEENLWSLITSKKPIEYRISNSKKKITISGRIIGGNLSIVSALSGTEYFPNMVEHILILEELDEQPYRIDRMLHQLKLSIEFNKLKGIILGNFKNCVPSKKTPSLELEQIFKDVFNNLPVVENFEFGHINSSLPIPYGILCEIHNNKLKFKESAVEA